MNKLRNILITLLVLAPWTYIVFDAIPNANIFTLLGVYFLVIVVFLVVTKFTSKTDNK